MRKIVIHTHTGYCGMDGWEFYEVPEDMSNDAINDLAYSLALDNAESYGIYPREADEYEEVDEDYLDQYSDNIEGSFEDYNPEKHDGHRCNGDTSWNQL